MVKNKKRKRSTGKTGYSQNDQFSESKIGSGFMTTLEGQPHEDENMVERIQTKTSDEMEK